MESQEAYESASSGLVRPANRDVPPIIYGVKCIEFQPPDFTLGNYVTCCILLGDH